MEYLISAITNSLLVDVIPWCLSGFFSWVVLKTKKSIDQKLEQSEAVTEGVQATLRCLILNATTESQKNGYADLHQRENIERMYKAYKKLDGNGMIEEIYKQFGHLPITGQMQYGRRSTDKIQEGVVKRQ